MILALVPLILGISDGAAAVWVAIVTTVLAPLVIAMFTNRRRIGKAEQKASQAEWNAAVVHQTLEEKIGTPNGRGNVVRMMEQMLSTMEQFDKRMDESDLRDKATMMLLTEHLKRYDRDHPPYAQPHTHEKTVTQDVYAPRYTRIQAGDD